MRIIVATTTVLLFALAAFLRFAPPPLQVRTQSQWQENRYVVERYVRLARDPGASPRVVIIGSSLSQRLHVSDSHLCPYNLAISGGSTLTGLRTVVETGAKPVLVLAEINVIERPANEGLVAKGVGLLSSLSPIFQVENMPINLLLSYRSKPDAMIAPQPPNPTILQGGLAVERDRYSTPVSHVQLTRSLAEFARLVGELESRGTKVVLFEMPINPELESTPRAVQIRAGVQSTMPNKSYVKYDDLAGHRIIHTLDGQHLDAEESEAVAKALMAPFATGCQEVARLPEKNAATTLLKN